MLLRTKISFQLQHERCTACVYSPPLHVSGSQFSVKPVHASHHKQLSSRAVPCGSRSSNVPGIRKAGLRRRQGGARVKMF